MVTELPWPTVIVDLSRKTICADPLASVVIRSLASTPAPTESLRPPPSADWLTAPTLPTGSRIAAGAWWRPDYRGPPLVSFDADLARGMGLKVGDTLSINLLGREITAVIANLRSIDWRRLGINFTLVFAPGTLEGAPQTHLAAVWMSPAEEETLVRAVTERYPNVSAIHVREALATIDRILDMIDDAVQLSALVTLAASLPARADTTTQSAVAQDPPKPPSPPDDRSGLTQRTPSPWRRSASCSGPHRESPVRREGEPRRPRDGATRSSWPWWRRTSRG